MSFSLWVVALGLFQALADIYPQDLEARLEVLRKSMVTADAFIRTDHHVVPFWQSETLTLRHRRLQEGDRASLWTYLDWMLSASSNAAASMVTREILLMVRYGRYPVGQSDIKALFESTGKQELSRMLIRGLQEPVTRNGLSLNDFRQGGPSPGRENAGFPAPRVGQPQGN